MAKKQRKVMTMGTTIFTVITGDKTYYHCTIETFDGESYRIFTEKGEGYNIGEIGVTQITELLATGSINNDNFDITPEL